MKKNPRFQDLSRQERDWIDSYLDGTIEPEAFEALQIRMVESAELRAVFRRYLSLDSSLRAASDASALVDIAAWKEADRQTTAPASGKVVAFPGVAWLAAAAAIVFFLGLGMMYFSGDRGEFSRREVAGNLEPVANGFAVVSQLFDAEWSRGSPPRRSGEMLGAETFGLASGTAEIQFFSGATMTVEGPAEITLKSAWEASCREGSIRMQVPPAARGFKLTAPETEIIDLGTEFGFSVRDGEGTVEVIDGEIALKHAGEEEKIVTKGTALALPGSSAAEPIEPGETAFPDVSRFSSQAADEVEQDFATWMSHRNSLAADDRLIAYYTFDREQKGALVPNFVLPRKPDLDGAVILAEPVAGRWPGLKEALEFRRPGARVRVNIPGQFSAFTFAAWVRIDSLDRRYNALFMGDGYETGEPHWQIRDDGMMMLSVMVDDSRPNPGSPEDAGFHRVYFSPPMWDISMSGEWLFLVSVFDPENREVAHYVDGKKISTQEIEDRFFIERLRIGNAEIGNWGLPFREDPWFAIRNLNGRMDEIVVFDAALGEEEISTLHERSRAGMR